MTNTARPEWANWVLHKLVDKRWKQADLAKEIGISHVMVSYLLNGRYHPKPKHIKSMAKALDLNATERLFLNRMVAKHVGYEI